MSLSRDPSREMTRQIYDLKRRLVDVKRAISPLIDICTRLMRFDLPLIPEDTRPYFRDVYDHVVRINEMVDSSREILAIVKLDNKPVGNGKPGPAHARALALYREYKQAFIEGKVD